MGVEILKYCKQDTHSCMIYSLPSPNLQTFLSFRVCLKVGPKLDMNFLSEGKSSMNVDLKNSKGQEFFRRMVKQSDVLIEPFRAGKFFHDRVSS